MCSTFSHACHMRLWYEYTFFSSLSPDALLPILSFSAVANLLLIFRDVASFDPRCLALLTYMKMAMADVEIKNVNECRQTLYQSLSWSMLWERSVVPLPLMVTNSGITSSLSEIISTLRGLGYSLDSIDAINSSQAADIVAYEAFIDQALHPAVQHAMWVDKVNYTQATTTLVSKSLPKPFNYICPKAYRSMASLSCGNAQDSDIVVAAERCLKALNNRLSDSQYFFGEKPSYLDALVYGYVAVIRGMDAPNNALKGVLDSTPHLLQLCQRIEKRHYPHEAADQRRSREAEADGRLSAQLSKNKLSVLVACGTMAMFGITLLAVKRLQ
eukprot:m.961877 g.961877  ORF g.961877 m.961877 type:complete len:328 (+) comp23887_c0_seq77:231-1214(+)